MKKDGKIYEVTIDPNVYQRYVVNEMLITQRIYNGCDSYPWMPVFAFLPVKLLNGKYAWMRKVYKRRFWAVWGNGFHSEPHVEYGDLFDVLVNPCDGSND